MIFRWRRGHVFGRHGSEWCGKRLESRWRVRHTVYIGWFFLVFLIVQIINRMRFDGGKLKKPFRYCGRFDGRLESRRRVRHMVCTGWFLIRLENRRRGRRGGVRHAVHTVWFVVVVQTVNRAILGRGKAKQVFRCCGRFDRRLETRRRGRRRGVRHAVHTVGFAFVLHTINRVRLGRGKAKQVFRCCGRFDGRLENRQRGRRWGVRHAVHTVWYVVVVQTVNRTRLDRGKVKEAFRFCGKFDGWSENRWRARWRGVRYVVHTDWFLVVVQSINRAQLYRGKVK
jgi:hypothetical protein